MTTCVYLCLPLFSRACLAMFTRVYLCLHLFIYVYSCVPMFTRDFLWLTQFARACLHKFTPVYLCFPLFTHKRGDLGIVFHSEIYVSQMLHVKLKLYKIKSTLLQCSIFWTIALLHLCTLLHRCTIALFHSFTVALHCFTVALFHRCTVHHWQISITPFLNRSI